jgi:hypothetical protein
MCKQQDRLVDDEIGVDAFSVFVGKEKVSTLHSCTHTTTVLTYQPRLSESDQGRTTLTRSLSQMKQRQLGGRVLLIQFSTNQGRLNLLFTHELHHIFKTHTLYTNGPWLVENCACKHQL